MANAGASIEAFLKLDASGFKTGIETATRSVTKFKEAMLDIGKEANTFNSGINLLSKALDALTRKMSLLESVDTKAVNNFKTMASALENVATAAQRLSVDAQRGSVGIEALNTIMQVFEAGVSSAEIVVKNLSVAVSSLGKGSTGGMENLKTSARWVDEEFKRAKSDLDAMVVGMHRWGQVMSDETAQSIVQAGEMKAQYKELQAQIKMMAVEGENAKRWLLDMANGGVQAFNKILTGVNKVNTTLNSGVNGINMYRNSLQGINSTATSVNASLNNLNTTLTYGSQRQMNMGTALNNTTTSMRNQSTATQNLSTTTGNLSTQFSKLNMEETKQVTKSRELVTSTNQASTSFQRQSSAMNQASSSMNRATTSANALGRALSSLRMIGTMVASMMVWNLAHNLITATRETVNAKSEMEGYFQMLHFSRSEIDQFNLKLNETVSQFQRINKYSLGETISSIGVEFNLSTKEMEKAMPVVSMITSEYLRAGRNANEASLAVKDILQGEFQRLSRETGVKGDQLKEAGWSGDKTDVMGLLEALDKVGKSRNWDVFVTKANSLNDAVLILQNRFGEWSADMVNAVQPAILGVFNTLMSVGGLFGQAMGKIWEWINSDGIASNIVKWTGLATAIGTVTTALIHYRTGANLVQIVQMGLRGSITATVLGLKAEEVATYGTRNAIVSKITSLKAEQVSLMGVKNALLTKVLGLKAETVATLGLKGAIGEEVLGRRLQEAQLKGATVAQKMAIVTEYEEQMAKRGTLASIIAKVAGVNMETFAEKGLIVALAERIATSPLYIGSLEAETVAEMSTAEAALFLAGTLTPLIAIFAAVALAVYSVVKPLQDASAEMKSFNNLVSDGDNIIKANKKTMDSYSSRQSKLQEELSGLSEGTDEYKRKQYELNSVTKDLTTATNNYNNSIKAIQMARSRQQFFEKRSAEIGIEYQTKLTDTYIKLGFKRSEANEMASKELREANEGAKQLRKTLQLLKVEADKGATKSGQTLDMLKRYGLDKESIRKYGENLANAQDKIQEGMTKFMTSDDMMERIGGWLELQQGRLEEWWTELNAFFEVRDWDSIGKKIQDGLYYIFTGFGAFDWMTPLKESIDKKGIWGTLMDWLWGEGDSDGAIDIVWDALNSWIFEPIASWLNWFIQDPVGNFNQVEDDLSLAIGKALFGKDSDAINVIIADWFNRNVTKPLLYHINHLPQYILDEIGKGAFTNFISWDKLLFGEGSVEGLNYDDFKNKLIEKLFKDFNLYNAISDAINQAFTSVDILGMIFDAIFPDPVSASDGGADHPSFMEDVSNIIGVDIQTWLTNFSSDPLGTLGVELPTFDIGALFGALTSSDDGTSILTWVNDNVVTPLSNGIITGISNIPIIGTIAQMLGLVPMENDNAYQTGYNLIDHFKRGVEQKIGEIPIIGDIARMLGLIPQEKPHAQQEGHGIGSSISDGTKGGMQNLGQFILSEFNDALGGIGKLGEEAYNTARNWANQLWDGVNSVLQRHSPGFFHDQFQLEFGQDIPNAITEASSTAYSVAQTYGQQISDGISATNFNTIGFDSAVGEYQADAQMVADSSYLMGTTTTTAFNDMTLAVNQSTMNMQGNVVSSYSTMQQSQSQLLNNMKQSNTTAYNEMYQKSNQSLLQMRDSTSNVTHQMINAWDHMKNSIIASANQLKSDSTAHFNQLSNTIGDFYRKIQNPSNWGAGAGSNGAMVRGARHPSAGKSFTRVMTRGATHHGAGSPSPYSRGGTGKTMTLRALKNLICPSGSCDIFDGYDLSQEVNVDEFLSSITGEHGFGWGDWSGRHYEHIRTTSNAWRMQSPTIDLVGGIPTNADYKVGDFENGTPKISFGAFQSMAESIFTAIPYRFYYDSNWKGSWLGALQAGACNCSDGAEALIEFARTCGFDGYKQHGTWTNSAGQKFGHFWAVINGKKMDTTGWQHGYGWSPSNSAGSPPVRRATHSPMSVDTGSVNITVNINEPVYGVDALDEKIQESVKQGLREEFNDPYTVAI